MPSLLKDRPTGRLGRLISALCPARAGTLPVQTGFPTSLADLFVKNHGRLKKQGPSSNRRKRRGAPAPPSPEPSPPPPSPPPPSPPPAAVSPPSTQPGPDLPREEPVCRPGGGAAGLGLGFLALVGVVSLALLVIWSRKVVAAVTVAAFSLFLLESVRASSLDRRPRPPATTTELDIDGRGYVSPIREVEAEPEPLGSSFSDSGRGISASILGIEERSEAGEDSCIWEAKPRKRSPWRKLIPRKLQRGRRIGKESGSLSLSSSFRSEVSQADSTLGGNAKAMDFPDSRRGRRNQADAAAIKSPDSSGPLRGDAKSPDSSGPLRGNAKSPDSSGPLRGRRRQADAKADAVGKSPDSSGPLRGMGDGDGATKSPDSSGPLRGMDAEVRAPMEIDEAAGVAGADGVGGGGVGGGRFPLVAVIVVVLVGLVAGRLPAVAFTVLVCSLQRLRWDGGASLGGEAIRAFHGVGGTSRPQG